MAVTLQNSSSYQGDATNPSGELDVATPTGTAVGDLLVLVISTQTQYTGCTLPTGFTLDLEAPNGGAAPKPQSLIIGHKIADGTEGATLKSHMVSYPRNSAITCLRFTGHDPTTPIDIVGAAAVNDSYNTSPATATAPSITTTHAGDLVIYAATPSLESGTTTYPASTFTTPSGFTDLVTVSGGGAYLCSNVYTASRTQASAGASGTAASSIGNSAGRLGYVTAQFAIHAAAAGGITLGGQNTTTASGSSAPSIAVALIGAALAIAGGTAGITRAPVLAGASATASSGTPGVLRSPALTGSGVTSATGAPQAGAGVVQPLTGQGAATALAGLTVSASSALGGQSAATTSGNAAAGASQALSGQPATTGLGAPAITRAPALSGIALTGTTGNVSPTGSSTQALTGNGVVGAAGYMATALQPTKLVSMTLANQVNTSTATPTSVGSVCSAQITNAGTACVTTLTSMG